MTTQEAIAIISQHHAVEEVTLEGAGYCLIVLKDGIKFGDGTHNWLVSEGKLKKIATLIAI